MRAAALDRVAGASVGVGADIYGVDFTAADDWAAERAFSCICDDGWTGPDCSSPQCPLGADPARDSLGFEVQNVTASVGVSREEQLLTFTILNDYGAIADIDEIQLITIAGRGMYPPEGNFTLTLDARAGVGDGGCGIWSDAQRIVATTAPISLANGEDESSVALRIRAALSALPQIGSEDQIDVSGRRVLGAGEEQWYLYEWQVTFVGDRVGGDVSGMSINVDTMLPPPWLLLRGVDELQKGSQMTGQFAVAYNDSAALATLATVRRTCNDTLDGALGAAWLEKPRGRVATALPMNATEDVISRRLTELFFGCPSGSLARSFANASKCDEAPRVDGSALTVVKVGTGGPGFALRVTFKYGLRLRGDLAQLELVFPTDAQWGFLTTATLAPNPSLLVNSPAASGSAETISDGAQLRGVVSITLPEPLEPDGWAAGNTATNFLWCAEAKTVRSLLQAVEDETGVGLGFIKVSRSRAYAPGRNATDGWDGGYTWSISFPSLAEDLPLLTVKPGDENDNVDAGAPSTAATVQAVEVSPGSSNAPANEVQLIDCLCSASSCATSSGVVLSFRGADATPLSPTATTDDVRMALAALPAIPDVRVSMYGGATLCSASGTTTAITFSHSPGPQPPLIVAAGTTPDLPDGSSFAIRLAPARGAFGGRARRGRRVLRECSNRGTCTLGVCTCASGSNGFLFGPSDGGGGADAEPGDGSALPFWAPGKVVANCGRPLRNAISCLCPPGSPRGYCLPGSNTCVCRPGFTGPICNDLVCPFSATSFFDVPRRSREFYGAVVAHAPRECGGQGVCNRNAGTCACVGMWGGPACSTAACSPECARGAPCLSMRALTERYETHGVDAGTLLASLDRPPVFVYSAPWDADMLRGCACDAQPGGTTYNGPAALNWGVGRGGGCLARTCPGGPDPLSRKAAYTAPGAALSAQPSSSATQRLQCRLTHGSLVLRFRGASSRPLSATAVIFDSDADAGAWSRGGESLEQALRELRPLGVFSLRVWQRGARYALGQGGYIPENTSDSTLALSAEWFDVRAGSAAYAANEYGQVPIQTLCDADGRVAVDITFTPTGAAVCVQLSRWRVRRAPFSPSSRTHPRPPPPHPFAPRQATAPARRSRRGGTRRR